jgi:hypothetical protein
VNPVIKDIKSHTQDEIVEDSKREFDKKTIENLNDTKKTISSEGFNFFDGSWFFFSPRP